jgi:RNA-binding protein
MIDEDRQRRIHELDVTLRVGKGGVEQVADELADQVADRGLVEVKFLRAAPGRPEELHLDETAVGQGRDDDGRTRR